MNSFFRRRRKIKHWESDSGGENVPVIPENNIMAPGVGGKTIYSGKTGSDSGNARQHGTTKYK